MRFGRTLQSPVRCFRSLSLPARRHVLRVNILFLPNSRKSGWSRASRNRTEFENQSFSTNAGTRDWNKNNKNQQQSSRLSLHSQDSICIAALLCTLLKNMHKYNLVLHCETNWARKKKKKKNQAHYQSCNRCWYCTTENNLKIDIYFCHYINYILGAKKQNRRHCNKTAFCSDYFITFRGE